MWLVAVVQVHLVEDSGFGWSDLATPALTFFGALAGIVAGGLIARRNLFDVEDRRAAQDRSMEDWRQTKEDAADKRRVRGIARALSTELSERQSLVVASAGHSMWWPPGRTAALPIADEDRTLLGVWLSDGVWDTLAHARMLLTSLDHDYPLEPPQLAKTEAEITGFAPGSSYLSTDPAKFRSAATAIAAALRGLRDEVERLTDEAEAGPARYDGWARAR